jgi:hypothetical protein
MNDTNNDTHNPIQNTAGNEHQLPAHMSCLLYESGTNYTKCSEHQQRTKEKYTTQCKQHYNYSDRTTVYNINYSNTDIIVCITDTPDPQHVHRIK